MKYFAIACLIFFQEILFAQDVEYAREVLNQLTGKKLYGRGYVNNGDGKAANYISGQFKKHKLQSFEKDYFQKYSFPINTFPGKVDVSIDGKTLIPGEEFVISSSANSVNQEFILSRIPSEIKSPDSLQLFLDTTNSGQLFIFSNDNFKKLYGTTISGVNAAALMTENTPGWHVSNGGKIDSTVWLKILKTALPESAKKILIKAENKFFQEYETQNVIGYVQGKKFPDQFIVLTAHYDHLGMMGSETMYPGANDNGSGTAMLLDMAKYYSLPENQPDRSIAFMAFSGEESGLNGSKYFADHPLLPLEKIQILINLDMVGTGSEGITVVNGELFPDVMKALDAINSEKNYLPEISARGESCNSDHCPFYQKGVKSIFIYTRGKEHAFYHTPEDNAENFPFTGYPGLFNLITDYIKQFN